MSLINQQDPDITKLDMGKIKEKKEELRKQKEEFLSQRFKVLHKESDHQLKNHLDQAREKGASTWLSTLPLKDLNYGKTKLSKTKFVFTTKQSIHI